MPSYTPHAGNDALWVVFGACSEHFCTLNPPPPPSANRTALPSGAWIRLFKNTRSTLALGGVGGKRTEIFVHPPFRALVFVL